DFGAHVGVHRLVVTMVTEHAPQKFRGLRVALRKPLEKLARENRSGAPGKPFKLFPAALRDRVRVAARPMPMVAGHGPGERLRQELVFVVAELKLQHLPQGGGNLLVRHFVSSIRPRSASRAERPRQPTSRRVGARSTRSSFEVYRRPYFCGARGPTGQSG